VAVNCGAIARDLIGSELFGHERGAYTGATAEREGLFAQAHGGSLFLDEIAELPLEQQPQLLRALETGHIRRLGSSREQPVDVGVICATHRTDGRLRPDLYHRLATVTVQLPPLRERLEDVPGLVAAFLDQLAPTHGERRVSDVAMLRLQAYDWPGNVRELRHATERACIMGGATLEIDDFLLAASAASGVTRASPGARPGAAEPSPSSPSYARHERWRTWERAQLADSLARYGSLRQAAKALGIPRSTLSDRVRRLGLSGELSPGKAGPR
jgi:DNA-binding NtrC family response regulator